MKNLFLILILILSSQTAVSGPGDGVAQRAADSAAPESLGEVFKQVTSSSRKFRNGNDQSKAIDNSDKDETCDELNADVCDILPGDPSDHLKFGISFINFNSAKKIAMGPNNCDCLKTKLQGTKSDVEFTEAMKKEREAVNQKILKSYGKKFVNQFAGNLEDMSFFLNQSSGMFSSEGKGIELQCMDQDRFANKVKETCATKNITDQEFIENRKDLFINAISNENTPFQYKMPAMANDILSSSKTSEFDNRYNGPPVNGTPAALSRFQYDQLRMDIAIRDPEARFMDRLIGGILKHPDYSNQITEAIGSGSSPVEALMNVIAKNIESTNYFSGMVAANEARNYLKDASTLENSLKFIMMVHPGVGLALSEKKAFENVRKVLKPGSTETFVNTLNNYKNVLEPVLIDRCNNMMAEFAQAVCTKDEAVIGSVDSDDLEQLLNNTNQASATFIPFKRGTHLHDLLICEGRVFRKSAAAAAIFTGVGYNIDGGSVRDSDYIGNSSHREGGNGKTGSHSLLNQISSAAAGSASAQRELGAIIDRNNQTRTGFSGPGIAVNKVYAEEVLKGRVMNLGNTGMTKDEAKKYIADTRKFEAKRSAEIANTSSINKPASSQIASNEISDRSQQSAQVSQSQDSAQPQNLSVPQTTTMITPNYSTAQVPKSNANQMTQSRELLRQYLSEKNDPVETAKAVSALDDSSAQELNRLRNERQSLLEQQLKDGQTRLNELRSELDDATAKVPASLVDRKIASAVEEEAPESDRSFGRNPRSIDQRTSIGGGFNPGNQASGSSVAAASAGSSNKVSRAPDDTQTQVTASTSSNGQNETTGSIVITSSDVKSSGTFPDQELNQEVQKYLADSDLSSTSIQDIKAKGIKLRFNVMENNQLVQKEVVVKYENLDVATRNQIDFKLAHKNVQNQVSKLSVLRMLIKQNQRL